MDFHLEKAKNVIGYRLTVPSGKEFKAWRSPVSWVLKAKKREGDRWKTLSDISGSGVLTSGNISDYTLPKNILI